MTTSPDAAGRDDRLRLHGRGPLPGLAQRAARFFDLPLQPDLAALCGRDATRRAAAAGEARAGGPSRPTGGPLLARDDIDLVDICTPGDTPRRDRDRRPRGRQARAVREAAGQHRRRGRGDGGGGRARRGRGRALAWSASPTAGCRRSRWPASWSREGRLGDDPARARAVPAGLDRRPASARWSGGCSRSAAGSGALGDIGAHIIDLAQYITGRAAHRRLGADRDVRAGAAAAVGVERARGRPGRRPRRGDRSTVDDAALFTRPASPAARSRRSRPPGSRPVARTRCASRSTGRRGALAFDLERHERAASSTTPTSPPTTAGLPPHPRHRARRTPTSGAWWPPGHVLGYEHALHPPGRATWSRRSRRGTRPRAVVRRRPAGAAGARRRRASSAPDRRAARADDPIAEYRRRSRMARPITLFTGQWADLPFEEVARLAAEWGYDGLEIACWGDHLDAWRGRRGRRLRRRAGSTSWRSTT